MMDLAEFKKIVFAIPKNSDLDIIGFIEPDVTPNFFVAELRYKYKKVFLLASYNRDLAFSSEYKPMDCLLNFINIPSLALEIKNQTGITVLTKEDLFSVFEARSYLCERDIKYWQPKVLGDALFNWWD